MWFAFDLDLDLEYLMCVLCVRCITSHLLFLIRFRFFFKLQSIKAMTTSGQTTAHSHRAHTHTHTKLHFNICRIQFHSTFHFSCRRRRRRLLRYYKVYMCLRALALANFCVIKIICVRRFFCFHGITQNDTNEWNNVFADTNCLSVVALHTAQYARSFAMKMKKLKEEIENGVLCV